MWARTSDVWPTGGPRGLGDLALERSEPRTRTRHDDLIVQEATLVIGAP